MATYVINPDGSVTEKKKKKTTYVIGSDGSVTIKGVTPQQVLKEQVPQAQPVQGSGWLQSGAFRDGVTLENTTKAVLGTATDASQDASAGFLSIFEEGMDAAIAGFGKLLGWMGFGDVRTPAASAGGGLKPGKFNQTMTQRAEELIAEEMIDEKAIVESVTPYAPLGWANNALGVDVEKDSVLAEKADALAGSVGHMAGTAVAAAVGIPAPVVTIITSFGSEVENAIKNGDATLDQAIASGLVSAGAEALTEQLFSGINIGKLPTADKAITTAISRGISNKTLRTLAKLGVDLAGEGAEEVISGVLSAIGQKLTYAKEADWNELFSSEAAWDSFVSGALMGAGGNLVGTVKSAINKTDYTTGLTKNEQAVVDQVYKDRVAEEQKSGKLTQLQKNEIYEQVVKDMDDGRITTDEIEKVLSKEELSKYKALSEEAAEYAKLYDTESGKMSQKQTDRLKELATKNSELSYEKRLEQARQKITKDTAQKVSGDRLNESYLERDRKNVAYTNDAAKYKGEFARKTVQSAIDSKVLNNTRYSHRFVDLLAKIAEDRGVAFDFTNNKKLKETGMALEGVTVNGFLGENGITINANSSKALNSVVGHEVTHVLEGTDMYQPLEDIVFEYAKATNQYDKRMQELRSLYEGKKGYETDFEAKLKKELVADLVGDYIFTDEKFVESLYTKNRSLWDKVKHEIDYLFRVATAGSEEARKIEKAKKVFEKVYESKTKKPTWEGGVRYSLGNSSAQNDITANYQKIVDSILQGTHTDKSAVLLGYTPDIYQELGMPSLPFVIGPGHIYSTVKTEDEARLENRYNKKMHYHGLGDKAVKNIYKAAQDPLMIIASKNVNPKTGQMPTHFRIIKERKDVNPKATPLRSTHSVVAIVDVGTRNQHLLLPVEITANRTVNGEEMDVHVLSSAYNKNVSELVREAVALENIGEVGVYYIKKGATLPADSGVQFPVHLSNKIASGGIIHNFSEKVNMNIMDATQSKQFKRWFGDWQNHPENASKVVNADGTPKVMYHGTSTENGEFYVFDYSKAVKKGGLGLRALGKGNYFTSKKLDGTERYGSRVIAAYLDIKKPFVYESSGDLWSQVSKELGVNTNGMNGDALQQLMRDNGYDGVISYNESGDIALAVTFDSNQIKSATDNIGTFDANNPDIRYSISKQEDTTPTKGWNIRGEDVAFVNSTEDLAPIGPNAKRVYTPDPNNLAPLPEKKLPANYLKPNAVDTEETGDVASIEKLSEQYGTLPQGENPVRDDTLPKSTTGEDKVSRTARTVKGAAATPDELVDLLDKTVAQGKLSYIPITNTDTVNRVYKEIVNDGWEDSLNKWESDVKRGKVSADLSAKGALLLNNAAKAGDTEAWREILFHYQMMGTNAGQAVQAMRILKSLEPDDKLWMIRRSIKQMVDDMKIRTPIEIDPELERQYTEATDETEREDARRKIVKQVAKQIPATLGEKWNALRYVNMLGNTRTQIRNIIGNVGMKITSSLKNSVATGIENVAYYLSGGKFNRTKSFTVSKEMKAAAKADFANMEALALSGGKYSDNSAQSLQFAQDVQNERQIFKNKFREAYRKATNWAMEKGDLIFSRGAYARALAGYLKAQGITTTDFSQIDPTILDEARTYAIAQAQEQTFRDSNWLADWVSKAGRRNDTPGIGKALAEGIVPFRKTPANVLIRATEYSPLGIVNSIVKSVHKIAGNTDLVNDRGRAGDFARSGQSISGAQIVDSWAKSLTGTGLFGLGMLLSNLGWISGGPDEDEDKDYFESQYGWQNYAVTLPDGTNFTIDFLAPSAMPLLMGVQLMETMQDGEIELKEIGDALLSIADPMIQMSMLQGVNDTLANIQFAENNLGQFVINAALSYLTQGLVNSTLGQLERTFEGKRMTTYVDKDSILPDWLQRTVGKASAKIPLLDYNQIPYINPWGEEETTEPLSAGLENMFSPAYIEHGKTDAVYIELNRLNDAQSDVNVYPSTPDKTVTFTDKDGVKHEKYNLSAEEYVELAKMQGITQKALVEELIGSAEYQNLNDTEKAKAIQNAYTYARELSRIEVLGADGFASKWMEETEPEELTNALMAHTSDERLYAYENPGKYAVSQAVGGFDVFRNAGKAISEMTSDKNSAGKPISNSRKKKVVAYINDLDMDYGQKILLYRSEYTTDDRYNRDIVEYLNSRDDISAAEMRTILEALNFKVSEDGKISW